jgi:hypothetical protein
MLITVEASISPAALGRIPSMRLPASCESMECNLAGPSAPGPKWKHLTEIKAATPLQAQIKNSYLGGEVKMTGLLEFNARAALCRQLAKLEPDSKDIWLAEAERWSRLTQKPGAVAHHGEPADTWCWEVIPKRRPLDINRGPI